MNDERRTRSTMFRVLPWLCAMLLCIVGCPSTSSSTDATADRGLVDATTKDTAPVGEDTPHSDIMRADVADGATGDRVDAAMRDAATDAAADDAADAATDAGPCPPGQSRSCRCGDSGVGGAVCSDAGVLGACDCSGRPPVLPPRLLTPHSVSRATTQRPTFRWVLPDGVTRARVTLARDRALTREVRSETVTGTSWRPAEALAFGVWFWRVEGLGDDGAAVWTSATWEFRAPRRDTPVDSSWGTLRDFNGDGYDDFVVNQHAEGGRRLAVFFGSREGVPNVPNQSVSATPPGVFRDRPSRPGDFNGDGLGDLAVSVSMSDLTASPPLVRGAVDIYLGQTTGIQGVPSIRVYPVIPDAPSWGFDGVIAVGDFDGDGYSDLVTGVQPRSTGTYSETQIAIYPGSALGITLTPFFTLGTDGAYVTDRMNTIGDYNDDGYEDLLSQWVWLLPGTPEGSFFVGGVPRGNPILGQQTSVSWDVYGLSIAGGDLNGDGRSDAVVGSRGTVEIYRSATVLLATMPDQVMTSPDSTSDFGRIFGSSVLSSTDINGDGFSDLLVGAPDVNGGSMYIYLGQTGSRISSPLWRRTGDDVGGGLYTDLTSTGLDVNGDGFDDIVTESIDSRSTPRVSVDTYAGASDFHPTAPTWAITGYRGSLPQ